MSKLEIKADLYLKYFDEIRCFFTKNFFNKYCDFCTYPVAEEDDFDFNERVFGGEIQGIGKNIAFLFNADHDKHIFFYNKNINLQY